MGIRMNERGRTGMRRSRQAWRRPGVRGGAEEGQKGCELRRHGIQEFSSSWLAVLVGRMSGLGMEDVVG